MDGNVEVRVLFADGTRIEGRAEIFSLKRRSCGWPFWRRVGEHDDIIAYEILPAPC